MSFPAKLGPMKIPISTCVVLWLLAVAASDHSMLMAAPTPAPRWSLGEGMTTVWAVAMDTNLPHGDFIEQGGLRCGQVVDYHVDGERRLRMKRAVV